MAFMPNHAPFVVLMFLGTCLLLGLLGLGFVIGLWRTKRGLAKWSVVAGLGIAAMYAGLLLMVSYASREVVLSPGEQKYFCEIDCHLAYSVIDVQTGQVLGAPQREARAAGTFYVVKLKTWFDERTISSRRARDLPLHPNARRVVVVDAQGREFPSSPEGLSAFEAVAGRSTPLIQPLRPGESYTTNLVFDLPAGIQNPRLLITDADRITTLLIGHENSFFHKKILFALAPSSRQAPGAASGQQPRESAAVRVRPAG